MEEARADQPVKEDINLQQDEDTAVNGVTVTSTDAKKEAEGQDTKTSATSPKKKKKKKKSSKCKKYKDTKVGASSGKSKATEDSSDSSDSSDSESEESNCSDSSDSSSEEERRKRKQKKKTAAKKKAKAKAKKHKRSKHYDSSDDSDSDSDSESESSSSESESEVEDSRRSRRHRRTKRSHRRRRDSPNSWEEPSEDPIEADVEDEAAPTSFQAQLLQLLGSMGDGQKRKSSRRKSVVLEESSPEPGSRRRDRRRKDKRRKNKKGSTLEYKRVDQLWDSTIHDYKLTESADQQIDEFDEYIFNVRRKFDWENKYRNTVVDIKSKILRDALQEIMKDVKSVSLVEEEPSLDPNMLFLYLDEIKAHRKTVLKARLKKEKKKKQKKRITLQIAHLKVLEKYINKDYAETKKTLFPMLEAGNITFDLLWALFKPNSIAYTTTYGSVDDPRCFKVDYANKESSFMRGDWYAIEGRYLEYDGKAFGLGEFEVDVDSFKGPRKITSLATYPLKYHKDAEGLQKTLVDRGKKFVTLQGMQYKFHKGLAFAKKKKQVAKVNINGRIMIDPAIFRRINPNYPISILAPKHQSLYGDSDDEDSYSDCCGSDSDEDGQAEGAEGPQKERDSERTKIRVVRDRDNKVHVIEVSVDKDGEELPVEHMDKLGKDGDSDKLEAHNFTEEELLIASPVVLGFSFSEKLWLEFSLGGVKEIEWNEGAFSSLVLPHNQKSIVKGMVSSHKFHAAKTIDDVVQGKGRGLVFVLHGPPGVGKTLTAEGIAEFLKCPLYSVSAGELGTDSRRLEHELQQIMDIAHSWGAVLLLDEADVFLEKREVHDIHRNALVSIFLRLLEYFQGILFLTTNRVETFDDAFQSRIHMPLRYGELTPKAKKEIWKTFIEKVRSCEGVEIAPFTDAQYTTLARNNLNGRQIKNTVRTAQSLALSEEQPFSMEHIKRVLEVAEDFDHDLKGGTGYIDAMRSYT